MNYLLLSHCFVKTEIENYKIDIFNYVIDFFKKQYENITIIVTGHGIDSVKNSIKADKIIWLPFLQTEIGFGHPVCVNHGLLLAKKLGAKKILKMRLDSLSVHENIFEFCEKVLEKEKTKCLITAQTNMNGFIGDLFMYGDIDFLISLWDPTKWVYDKDGMANLNNIFIQIYNCKLHDKFSYRDNKTLKWIFLSSEHFNNICNANLEKEYEQFLWDKYYGSYITENVYYN